MSEEAPYIAMLLFFAIIAIAHIFIIVAVIFALLSYFSKVEANKAKYSKLASKSLMACALFILVGSGGCLSYLFISTT